MKIIAVDDEELSLKALVSKLRKVMDGAEIYQFSSGIQAHEFVKENGCDVAFLDIEMSEMNGIDLAKKIKVINPRVNIIFITGYTEYMQSAFSVRASGYVLKPVTVEQICTELEELRYPIQKPKGKRMRIRTFGNFEVFVDDTPIKFQYTKTKELFAYLVDRNGALCKNAEIMEILWPEEEGSYKHRSYLNNLRSDLLATLKACECENVIVKRRGGIGIAPEQVECDYFDWNLGKAYAINAYRGEYMSQYSWSEFTHGLLEG